MGEITLDQLNAVFGDLAQSQKAQVRALAGIENLVSEKLANVTEHIASLKNSIDTLSKTTAKTNSSKEARPATTSNNNSTDRVNKTINSGFRALTASLLSREGKKQMTVKPRVERRAITTEGMPTKAERLMLRALNEQNSKTGALLKEVQSQRASRKEDGGLFKFLSPFLLLFGGVAALTYGAMKIPGVRSFFQSIKTGGIKQTLSGLINKIKPQDKSITEWLRSLPLVGRFFDVYDAFSLFIKGDWRGGLKHLAFAIPGAELFAEILVGKGAKQKILEKGGATATFKSISLKGIWENVKTLVGDAFANISTTFKEIREIFGLVTTGDQTKMIKGFKKLSQYFPLLTPIAEVLEGLTGTTFNSSFAKKAEARVGVGNVKFGDVLQEAMRSMFDRVGQIFNTIGSIFKSVFEIIGSLGDVFSDDYGKQSAALNKLDKISPGTSAMLRQVLTVTAAFKELDIRDGDDLVTKLKKVSAATWKGITAKVDRYSVAATKRQEEADIYASAQKETDPEKRAKLDKQAAEIRLENAQADLVALTNQTKALRDKYQEMEKVNEENIRTKGYAKFDIPTEIDPIKRQYEQLVERGADIAARKRYAEQYLKNINTDQTTPDATFSAKLSQTQPADQSQKFTFDPASAFNQTPTGNSVDITATPESVTPNAIPAGKSLDDALKNLPLDELSYLKYLPTQAQLLKDQNSILMQLLQVNKDQPASVFANINQGGPTVIGGGGARSVGGRGAF